MKIRQAMYIRHIQARSCNHCCSGKAVNITYSECVVLFLGIQNSMSMRHIICGLSGSTIFSTLSHKRQEFRREVIEYIVQLCFDFL
jgi:hypothetical protein